MHRLIARNEFLFHWKNLQDKRLLLYHVLSLGPRLLSAMCRRRFIVVEGFISAIRRAPRCIVSRRQALASARVSDADAIIRINGSSLQESAAAITRS